MKQISIRDFQKRFYTVLRDELPVLVTVTAKKKGQKVHTEKRCIVIPYDPRIEADYNKIELYQQTPEPMQPVTQMHPSADPLVLERTVSINGNPITPEPPKEEKKGFFGLFKK